MSSLLICRVDALSVGTKARHVASTKVCNLKRDVTFHKCRAWRRKELRAWTPFLSYVCANHTPSLARNI